MPQSSDDESAPLDARIEAAQSRAARRREGDTRRHQARGMEMGWRMLLDLLAGILVGLAMGWGLDHLFDTLPLFLIVFCLLGFGAGVRTMLRSAREFNRERGAAARDPLHVQGRGRRSGQNGPEGDGLHGERGDGRDHD